MTAPDATEWHAYQDDGNGRCTVCRITVGRLTGYRRGRDGELRMPAKSQRHRAATTSEQRRGTAWVMRSAQCREGVRSVQGKMTAYAAPEWAMRAVAMIAAGRTYREAARDAGTALSNISRWKKRHPELWSALMCQAVEIARVFRDRAGNQSRGNGRETVPSASSLDARRGTTPRPSHRPEDGPLAGTAGEGMTLSEFFEQTYRPARLLNRSGETVIAYRAALSRFDSLAGRPVCLSDLSDDLVTACVAMHLGRGFSPATCNRLIRTISAVWRLAHRRKLVAELPDVEKIKAPKRKPVAWSLEELAQLLQAAAESPGAVGSIPAGKFWLALLLVLYDTGLRVGAALKLPLGAVDLDSGWLRVPAEIQKHSADQVFRLHVDTIQALRRMLVHNATEHLLPWPGRVAAIYTAMRSILRRAGLPHSRRDLFHKIRRTAATAVADKLGRAAAQDFLGHSALHVTEMYLDPSKIAGVQAVDVLPRPMMPNKETA